VFFQEQSSDFVMAMFQITAKLHKQKNPTTEKIAGFLDKHWGG